jgi:hypothetical protein
MTWYKDYIGLKWKEDFNCWDLVKKIYLDILSIDAKTEFDSVENPLDIISNETNFKNGLKNWIEVNEPKEFDLCAMGKNKIIHHVGLYIEHSAIFHITKNRPACCQLIKSLSSEFKTIKFYRHASRI